MNLNPKEEAKELVHIFYISLPNNGSFTGLNNINKRWEEGKNCALIAANKILSIVKDYEDKRTIDGFESDALLHWKEVKTEIEKL